MKILFLLKKHYDYGSYSSSKAAGLFTSATFVAEALEKFLKINAVLEVCVDGNEVDHFVAIHSPDICILEAIWVTPEKMSELTALHPNVKFIIRIHSNLPFLSAEGNAVPWIKEFVLINGLAIAFNNQQPLKDFKTIGVDGIYLPNIYMTELDKDDDRTLAGKLLSCFNLDTPTEHIKEELNIGCFGAIRPFKNQLVQAMACMGFAQAHRKTLYFHMNSTRVEQLGAPVLKNIRGLFEGTKHHLVEHDWKTHEKFLMLVRKMDMGLQLSLSESFNIITADFVSQGVPIIVSPAIEWMPQLAKVDPFDVNKIIDKIGKALRFQRLYANVAAEKLKDYNLHSIETWGKFLHRDVHISF